MRFPCLSTEDAVSAARADFQRANRSVEVARQLLIEAQKREKDAARATAKGHIDAELAELAKTAKELDKQVVAVVAGLLALQDREAALHRTTTNAFTAPWQAPRTLTAARSLATIFGNVANSGLAPKKSAPIVDAVDSGIHSIRQALTYAD